MSTGAFIIADLLGYQQCANAGFLLILSSVTYFVYIIDNNQDSAGFVPREAQ